ncbi:MAG TPA: hypothetical protein VH395_05710 [Jatrophihabitantaceae bacterium]
MKRWMRAAATLAAFVLVWFALVAPDRLERLTPAAFLRIPLEALVVVALAIVLPPRARRVLAVVVGVVLGLLTIVKLLDLGYFAELDRPFNPVSDWGTLGPAVGVVRDSVGSGWADAAVVGAVLVAVALPALLALSAVRLTRLATMHRRTTARAVVALGVVWVVCAAFGAQLVAGAPVASTNAAGLAYGQVRDVRAALADRRTFGSQLAAKDTFAGAPAADLLSGLRGKDVIVAFVESYGRVAVQGSSFAPGVDAVLRSGTRSLRAAGFDSRSAFLTSPTFGGISWLAHSTLQSGLWIDTQQRYNQLVDSDRFTLSDAFKRGGWRTVGDVPSNPGDWPQGRSFYHYDQLYNARNVGYAGPSFSYADMPDQYTLAAFQRLELARTDRAPVMAEIDLVSSHTPWTPLPRMVPWDQVGDGSIFDGMPAQGPTPNQVWRDANSVRTMYGRSVEYSLSALISFVQQAHDDNLVLVVLGDHQPATIVSGTNAGHDVPITIIAHDPDVLARISSWGWQQGMLPGPGAPVWRMDAFRDRFLSAYGPQPDAGVHPNAHVSR